MRTLLSQQQEWAQKSENLAGGKIMAACTLVGALARQLPLAWRRIVQIPHTSRHHKLASWRSLQLPMHSTPCHSATLLSSDAISKRFCALHLPRCCRHLFLNVSTTLLLATATKAHCQSHFPSYVPSSHYSARFFFFCAAMSDEWLERGICHPWFHSRFDCFQTCP